MYGYHLFLLQGFEREMLKVKSNSGPQKQSAAYKNSVISLSDFTLIYFVILAASEQTHTCLSLNFILIVFSFALIYICSFLLFLFFLFLLSIHNDT